ncbi:unnamed protein product, partial [Polarella glacialis]
FVGGIDADVLITARLLGADVHFLWQQVEYQILQVYRGDLRKKVGTSGNVDKSEACPASSPHSACLKSQCSSSSHGCTLELPDWFAHVPPDTL